MVEKKRHILQLTDQLEIRGSSTQILMLVDHLDSSRYHITTVTPGFPALFRPHWFERDVLEYKYLTHWLIGQYVRRILLRDMQLNRPDLIHIHTRRMLPLGQWLAQQLKVPYLCSIYDFVPAEMSLQLDRQWLGHVTAVSSAVKTSLIENSNLEEKDVEVTYGGVELAEEGYEPGIMQSGVAPVVGVASPLEPIKGVDIFLQAAAKVCQQYPEVEFLIAGTGPEEAALRKFSRELKIETRVTFLSSINDFAEALRTMDIYCLPSLQQGLGTIMLEAMSFARPVIACGVGGVHTVVTDRQTGLLVIPGDVEGLATAIEELLESPQFARELGERARVMIQERFRIETLVERTQNLYQSTIEKFSQTSSA